MTSVDKGRGLTAEFESDRCDILGGGGSYYTTNTGTASKEDVVPFEFKHMSSLKFSPIDNSIGIWVEVFREELGEE